MDLGCASAPGFRDIDQLIQGPMSASQLADVDGLVVSPKGQVPHPRVVYIAMKSQLRGRIRRNVTTLLELGAEVTVLTVRSNKDFFVGLAHPRLRAEFLEARSHYVRVSQYASRRRREHGARSRPPRTRPGRDGKPASRVLRRPDSVVRTVLLAPFRILAALSLLMLRALPPTRPIAKKAGRAFRQLLRSLPRAPWTAARGRRLVLAAWMLKGRPHVRAPIRWRRAITLATIGKIKNLLRPWHRMSRFFAFWRESAGRATALVPDLVVSSDLPGLVGAGRVARRLRIPHLHDCHELYLESTSFRRVERQLLAPVERRYIRRADSVVAVNSSIAREYARRCGREPVVVRNCTPRQTDDDLANRDLRALAGLPASARVVLYQGGFSVGRGLDVCVKAVAELPEDAHLVLLGFGPLEEDLQHIARIHGVANRVHVLRAVPPEELASWTVSATVGLMPYQPVSRNNLLALPNKIFEYTAVGVPIVVSDLPELRQIALGAGCGETYDPFDAGSLAAALQTVLDPDRYPQYREAALAFGRVNAWENEREILIGEMLRVCPHLRSGVQGRAG
jgi:glycosyltransferase involved in cell wall biosynthesis